MTRRQAAVYLAEELPHPHDFVETITEIVQVLRDVVMNLAPEVLHNWLGMKLFTCHCKIMTPPT